MRDLVTRRLAPTETSISMLFWSNVAVSLAGITTLTDSWQPLGAAGAAWFLLAGALNAVAHFVMIEAMRSGEAALVAPFRYTALIWAVVIGFIVWEHLPDAWVMLGAHGHRVERPSPMILLEAPPLALRKPGSVPVNNLGISGKSGSVPISGHCARAASFSQRPIALRARSRCRRAGREMPAASCGARW